MQHRHITVTHELTSAAIDDIIDRGGRLDWRFLRDSAQGNPSLLARIRKVCDAHVSDPFDQKYHLWRLYAER